MDYILTSRFHFSKGSLKCVQKYTSITEKKSLGICSIRLLHYELATFFNKSKGKKFMFPILTLNYYPYQKQLKLVLKIVFSNQTG